jgi:hypothetical protein
MKKLILGILIYLFSMPFSSCSMSDSVVAESELASIRGKAIDSEVLEKTSVGALQNADMVYLYENGNMSEVLDSVSMDAEGNFVFNNVKPGMYDVVAQGEHEGGIRRRVQAHSGEDTEVVITTNIYVTQYYVIDESVTNITIINGPASYGDGALVLNAVQGDSIPLIFQYTLEGEMVIENCWIYLGENGLPAISVNSAEFTEAMEPAEIDEATEATGNTNDVRVVADYLFLSDNLLLADLGPNNFSGSVAFGNGFDQSAEGDWVEMNSSSAYSLNMPSLDEVLNHNDFTITTTFMPEMLPSGEGAICGATHWNAGVETYGYEVRINERGYVEFVLGQDVSYSWTVLRSEYPVELSQWTTVTAQYHNGTASLFVNDQPVVMVSDVPPVVTPGLPFDIGYRSSGTPRNQFSGRIHRVSVYQGQRDHAVVTPEETESEVESEYEIVADYLFSSSSALLTDLGPNGFSGEVLGSGFDQSEEGDWVEMNAGSSYSLTLPSLDEVLNLNDFSITATFMPEMYPSYSSSGEGAVCGATHWSAGIETYGYEVRITRTGYVEFVLGQDVSYSWTVLRSEFPIELAEWTTITAQYQNGTAALYVNDQPVVLREDVPPVVTPGLPFDIGYRSSGTPRNQFSGRIHRISVYQGQVEHNNVILK